MSQLPCQIKCFRPIIVNRPNSTSPGARTRQTNQKCERSVCPVTALPLNIAQERELHRLLEYERKTCSAGKELVYHCAFPYRPDNDLQAELIELGYLATKNDRAHGTVVRITSDGYSYFPNLMREEDEKRERAHRDSRLIGLTAIFIMLSMIIGFLCGYLLR